MGRKYWTRETAELEARWFSRDGSLRFVAVAEGKVTGPQWRVLTLKEYRRGRVCPCVCFFWRERRTEGVPVYNELGEVVNVAEGGL